MEFLEPLGLTRRALAERLQIPYGSVIDLIKKRRGVTPRLALRLAKLLGTTPDFWLNLQTRWDLYEAKAADEEILTRIHPLIATS